MAGATIFRLYDLQFTKYDLYTALASSQHQVYNQLEPARGRIFLQDGRTFSDTVIYPVATNKEFAHVYAVPVKIENASGTAEELYKIFDRVKVEKEVADALDQDPYFASLESENPVDISPADLAKLAEFREIKRDLEITVRKELFVNRYFAILTKPNDPYEPIRSKVDEAELKLIKNIEDKGLGYMAETHRYYPENNIGAHIVGFVGHTGDDRRGQYGLEGFFDQELSGERGSLRMERAAGGQSIIINDREHNRPLDGSDLVLTINRSIQFTACSKLNEAALRHEADGGSVVVMEPATGAILAMCAWPDYDPNNYGQAEDISVFNNPGIFFDYEPGSIFKVITMAAAINEGKVTPQSTYFDKGFVMVEGWPKPIRNSDFEAQGGYGTVDMTTVLEKSLNTGAIYAMQKIGAPAFARYVVDFGFGERTGVELKSEVPGNIASLKRKTIRPVEAATASFGQGFTATPLQIAAAFSAIANGGILMKPYLVGEIITPTGQKIKTQPQAIRRVISERTALIVSGMAVRVVEDGHAARAAVSGYYIGGKTGTAQVSEGSGGGYGSRTIHSFVGFGPVEDPKFVMLVQLDHPKDVRYAVASAAPLFGEIAEFILDYYEVPKER